jgi:hypothetical protein
MGQYMVYLETFFVSDQMSALELGVSVARQILYLVSIPAELRAAD